MMPSTVEPAGLNIELLESDPAPTFVVKIGSTATDFEFRFCNEAFREEGFDRDVHAKGKEALLFRSWVQACGKPNAHHDFRDWTWTARVVGESGAWKVVNAKKCKEKEPVLGREHIPDEREQFGGGTGSQTARSSDGYQGPNGEAHGYFQGKKSSIIRAIPGVDLHARWESIQTMMEMSDVGVFEYNTAGLLIHANEAWYKLSSHPKTIPEHVEFSFMDLVYPDDQALVMSMWNTLSQGTPVTFEMRWKGRPGSTEPAQWVLSACVPVFDDEKNLVSIAGNTIDIMAQKRSQQAAQAQVEALEQARLSELKFARFAQLSPIAIYIFVPQTGMKYVNDHFYELTACSSASLEEFEWATIVADDDAEEVESNWNKMLDSKISDGIQFQLKKTWIDQDGMRSKVWVQSSNYPELDAHGNVISIMGTLFDISQFKWAEAVQKRRTEEALEAKRQQEKYMTRLTLYRVVFITDNGSFIDMTSHELRNPLSAVVQCADSVINTLRGMADRTRETSNPSVASHQTEEEIRSSIDSLQTIVSCSLHQKRVIDDVLTLSKLDSNLITITPTRVQSTVVVSEALKIFDVECSQMDIKLEFQKDAALEGRDWVMLDPSRLLQVLINLLTNAIKFTKDRPVRNITVTLGTSSTLPRKLGDLVGFTHEDKPKTNLLDHPDWGTGDKIYLWLKVEDTGCGMTTEEQKRLFSRFSQATPRTHIKYGGSGLGLFISKTLATLQGGAIGVASKEDVGSTFAFYVSARTAHAPVGESLRTHPGLQRTVSTEVAMRKANLRVLIVEDNVVNQKVLKRQLQKFGWDVDVAGDGEQALRWLKNSVYWHGNSSQADTTTVGGFKGDGLDHNGNELDIILMDIEMPVMDGLTCARRIRSYEEQGFLGPPRQGNNQGERSEGQHPVPSQSPTASNVSSPIGSSMPSTHRLKPDFRIPILAVSANARTEQVEHCLAAGMDDSISKPFRVPELWPKILRLVKRLA